MAWMIAAGMAAASYLSADQQNKQNAKNAKNSGYVNLTQSNNPWGPDAQYRMWIMDAGADNLGMPRNAKGTYANPYAPQGGSTTGSSWPGVNPQTRDPALSNLPPANNGGQGGAGVAGSGTRNPDPSVTLTGAKMPTGLTPKQQKQWTAEQERQAGANKKGKAGAGTGTGGAKTAPAGTNVTTQQVMDAMYKDTAAPNRTEDAAVNYTNKLLSGGETNPYRTEAAQAVRDASSNANLDRYINELWGGAMPGSGSSKEGRAADAKASREASRASRGYTQATTGYTGDPGQGPAAGPAQQVGVVDDIQKIIEGKITRPEDESGARAELKKIYEGQGIPQEYRDMLERQYKEAAQRSARDMNALFVGANMQGSSSWQDAFAQGQADASQGYSDRLIGANFDLYGSALQMGQGYDLADQQYMGQALGLGTQYDIAAQDRAAQERAAANAASSSAGSYAAGLASQERLARMGALGDAIRGQQQGQQFGAQGLSGLSGLYSGDTQQALSMVPDLSNLNTAAWGSLGNIGVGRDQVNASIKNANTAANAQRGIANSQLDWQKQMWNDPLTRLGKFTDLVNASSGAYGSQTTHGQDQRNVASPGFVSPWGQAIAGGIAGYTYGSNR